MSDQQEGNYADHEPQRKRQKCGDGDEKEVDEIIVFGGPMYDEATARKMLKEVVLFSADKAEDGEAVIGFDPSDAALDNTYLVNNDFFGGAEVTPLIYFVEKGDAKMCRYLVSRGASTTKSPTSWSPLYTAIHRGHLEICKFLQANGASHDIWDKPYSSWTPFHAAVLSGHHEVVRWLVLQGALCADRSSEEIDTDRIYPEYFEGPCAGHPLTPMYEQLIEWVREVTQSHSSVLIFLLGTLPPAPDKGQSRALQYLSGHPGVRKHIGDFVGLEVTKRRHLRILRSVLDVVPAFINT